MSIITTAYFFNGSSRVVSAGKICCAVVRDVNKSHEIHLDTDASNLFMTDYHFNSFIELLFDANQSKIPCVTLVLNAFDISPIKMAAELTKDEVHKNLEFNIEKQIEIIVKAWELSRHVDAPLRIINLDSGAAYHPISGWSMYCAGKAYINMFLKVFSKENKIPLVLYDPGVVDTKMQETIRSSNAQDFPLVETFRNYQTSKQLHSPKEIAEDILERYLLNWTALETRECFAK